MQTVAGQRLQDLKHKRALIELKQPLQRTFAVHLLAKQIR
jgi:hypothetical protein